MNQQNGGSSWTQTDSLIAGCLAGGLGVSIVFWLAGQVSALFTGHGWPDTNLGEAVRVAFGIIRRPFVPRAAWPAAAQHQIPAAPIYYFVLILMVAGGVFGSIWLVRFFREATSGGGGGGRGGLGQEKASWARRGSLKTLVVAGPEKGRLVLGKAQGKLVAAEPRQSCIVMGPSQSGKTTGLAIPAILEWEGPVIATSVKTDLARDTLEWRKKTGKVWVYDPTSSTSLPGSTWSPLDGARTWGGAKKIANWLVGAGQGEKGGGLNDAQFWYTAAGKLLAPHLFAAAANGYTMADVVRWIDTQEDFELRALLQATGVEEAIQAAEASWQREERARSSIYTTAEVVIEAYSDPTVLESANSSAIQPESFFDGGYHTLYVCAPGHEQSRLRPVFSTLLKQFITAAYEKSSAQGGTPLDPPLLIVLDEAANIAPLSDLDAIASTAAGHGIQLLTVWQDLSQIKARYSDRAQTVINNHRAKVVLSGISDTESLDYVSRLIGSEEVKQISYTTDAEGRKQKTESKGDKNLAPSDVLRRIKPNEGVLVYGALLPSRLILRPWYKHRVLRARAHGLAEARSAFSEGDFRGAGEVAADTVGRIPGADIVPGIADAAPAPIPTNAPALPTGNYDDYLNATGAVAPANPYGQPPVAGSPNPYGEPGGYQPPPATNPYGQPAPGSYGQPPANPYGQPPPTSSAPSPYGQPPAPYGQPVPPNGGAGKVPPIEDLFDFSDFADWDDDDDDDDLNVPPSPYGNPAAPAPYTNTPPAAPGGATTPPANGEARDRFAAAMDEWLKMFPESKKKSENEDGTGSDPASPNETGSAAAAGSDPYRDAGFENAPFNSYGPSAGPSNEVASSPAPADNGAPRDNDYEEFLAWKRQREQSQAASAPPAPPQIATGPPTSPGPAPLEPYSPPAAPVAPPAGPTNSAVPSFDSVLAQHSGTDVSDEAIGETPTPPRNVAPIDADAPLYGNIPARPIHTNGNGNGNGKKSEDVVNVDDNEDDDDAQPTGKGRYFSPESALRGSVPAPRRPSSDN